MVFDIKESSRHRGNPAKLFLFKGSDPMLESLMRSVTIIPGATEFGYGTTLVTDSVSGQPKNRYAGQAVSDFTSSLEDLLASAPHAARGSRTEMGPPESGRTRRSHVAPSKSKT